MILETIFIFHAFFPLVSILDGHKLYLRLRLCNPNGRISHNQFDIGEQTFRQTK